MQDAAIRFSVTHKVEDVAALASANGKSYRSLWLALVCVFALAFLAAYVGYGQEFLASLGVSGPFSVFIAYLVPLVALAWGLRVFRLKANSGLDPRGYFLRQTQFSVNDAGVTSESEVHTASYKWAAFLKSVETGDHFFLYVDRASALIIPKRSFASDAEKVEFGRLVREYIPAQVP
jgi:hypothetical protein